MSKEITSSLMNELVLWKLLTSLIETLIHVLILGNELLVAILCYLMELHIGEVKNRHGCYFTIETKLY